MKRFLTIICCAICALSISSCNNDDDNYYYSTVSGDGSLSIGGYYPYWLYRMVVTSTDTSLSTYLLGGTTTVTSSENFVGRGAAAYFTYDTSDTSSLDSATLTIGEDGVEAGYTTYIDYDRNDEDYISLVSGSIQILSGNSGYYKIRILGVDAEGENISIGYNGYIYADFTDSTDSESEE